MIKEKTTYISTITGKEYTSFTEAVKEERAIRTQNVGALINKFRTTKQEAQKAFAELHKKYDPVLDEIVEELNNYGVDVCDLESADECSDCGDCAKSSRIDDISELFDIIGSITIRD